MTKAANLLRRQIRLALDLLRRNRRDSARTVLANALKGKA